MISKEDMIRFAHRQISEKKGILDYVENPEGRAVQVEDDIAKIIIADSKKEIEYHENVIELVIEGRMKIDRPSEA